jgi:F420-dependent methylenetetrahydromethanopterin dehydrogenase
MAAHVPSMTVGTGAGPLPWKLAAAAHVTDAGAAAVGEEALFEVEHANGTSASIPRHKNGRVVKKRNLCMEMGILE